MTFELQEIDVIYDGEFKPTPVQIRKIVDYASVTFEIGAVVTVKASGRGGRYSAKIVSLPDNFQKSRLRQIERTLHRRCDNKRIERRE